MVIIGIGYKADTGKDTAAEYLVRQYGFKRFAYGDLLRDLCNRTFLWSHHEMTDRILKEEFDPRWGLTRRQGVQRMGDAVRNEFGDDILVKHARMVFQAGLNVDIVVSDVRKRVECDLIKEAGGRLWRMHRDAAHGVSAHKTESELDDYTGWDADIGNNGSLEDLYARLDALYAFRFMKVTTYDNSDIERVMPMKKENT